MLTTAAIVLAFVLGYALCWAGAALKVRRLEGELAEADRRAELAEAEVSYWFWETVGLGLEADLVSLGARQAKERADIGRAA